MPTKNLHSKSEEAKGGNRPPCRASPPSVVMLLLLYCALQLLRDQGTPPSMAPSVFPGHPWPNSPGPGGYAAIPDLVRESLARVMSSLGVVFNSRIEQARRWANGAASMPPGWLFAGAIHGPRGPPGKDGSLKTKTRDITINPASTACPFPPGVVSLNASCFLVLPPLQRSPLAQKPLYSNPPTCYNAGMSLLHPRLGPPTRREFRTTTLFVFILILIYALYLALS